MNKIVICIELIITLLFYEVRPRDGIGLFINDIFIGHMYTNDISSTQQSGFITANHFGMFVLLKIKYH